MTVCSKHVLFDLSSRLASNDTTDSVLRHREVGRAKDLSAPRYSTIFEKKTSHEQWPSEARFASNGLLKNQGKCSSFYADVARDKRLGHYFLPPRLTEAVYYNFVTKHLPGSVARLTYLLHGAESFLRN